MTVIHPRYGEDSAAAPASHAPAARVVSHQKMSRLGAELPAPHFIAQSRPYGGGQLEQGSIATLKKTVLKSVHCNGCHGQVTPWWWW